MRVYLGTNPSSPSPDLIHCPIIKIAPREVDLSDKNEFTHIIFTSKNAVALFGEIPPVTVLAVGEATAGALAERGISPIVAPRASQEGIIDLLKMEELRDAYVLLPTSSRARGGIVAYLVERDVRHQVRILYDTVVNHEALLPPEEKITELIFTSPSTIDAYVEMRGAIPSQVHCTPIGPITKERLHHYS